MSEPWYGKRMSHSEIVAFLNDQATGVLSLTNDGAAYGIPIAFAYDDENDRAIFDLGFAPGSKKRAFIDATAEVCLTLYEWNDHDDWQSVLLSGQLVSLDDSDVDEGIEAWFHTVAKDIDVDDGSLELQWYELRAEELSGRHAP